MKINVVQEKEEFTPINITLCIETEKELQELWHRMNLSLPSVGEAYKLDTTFYEFKFNDDARCYKLWNQLDNIMLTRRIKP